MNRIPDSLELIAQSVLCSRVVTALKQRPDAGLERIKVLKRADRHLESIEQLQPRLRSRYDLERMELDGQDAVLASNDFPVLEKMYGTIVYTPHFLMEIRRHRSTLAAVMQGRPVNTEKCERFYRNAEEAYGRLAHEYDS